MNKNEIIEITMIYVSDIFENNVTEFELRLTFIYYSTKIIV